MEEKKIGISVKKDKDFSEWFTQVVSDRGAKLADIRYGVQGFIVHRPWGFKILRKIYELLEKEVEKAGHEPYLFPTVIKKDYLTKEEEHAGFAPDVFWITQAGNEKLEEEIALRPTGETQIYPLYSLWLRSYNDLPFKGYQSRITVFRNEMATRPFIRGREFMFFETHDVFETHEEAIEQVKKDLEICKKVILNDLKIPFMFFKRPKWDKFKGADDTFVPDTIMPDGRRLQVASTHDLGQNFAKAFDIKIKDKQENEKFVYQTCFGPGIWRLMAALIGVHGDDNGLVLPFGIAPTQVVVIPLIFAKNRFENKKVLDKCKELKKRLEKAFCVKLDDSNETPGYKYNQYELMGVPLRLEVGPEEVKKDVVTLVRRTDKRKVEVDLKDLEKEIKKQGGIIDREIKDRAEKYFRGNTKNAKNLIELKEIIEKHRGFIRVPFCSIDNDGWKCAEQLKADTSADVSGTLYPNAEKGEGNCVICGKKAQWMVYVAKSY